MFRVLSLAAGGLAAASALAVALPTAEAQPPAQRAACFNLDQLQNSRLANPRTLYLRVNGQGILRLRFAGDCNTASAYSLVLHPANNENEICSAIALDVHVRETGEACIPKSLSRLTPDEAAALPANQRP